MRPQYIKRSPRRTPEVDLQSDSEDADLQRDDELESEDDYDDDDPEADPGKRALNAVIRDAAIDPFAPEGGDEQDEPGAGKGPSAAKKERAHDGAAFGGASGSNSGSWMCVDEWGEDADDEAAVVPGRFGVHRKATASASSARRRSSPSSSSTVKQGSSSPPSNKRRSPSVEDFVGLGDGDDSSARQRQKKVKREAGAQDEDVQLASSNERTCRASRISLLPLPLLSRSLPSLAPALTSRPRPLARSCVRQGLYGQRGGHVGPHQPALWRGGQGQVQAQGQGQRQEGALALDLRLRRCRRQQRQEEHVGEEGREGPQGQEVRRTTRRSERARVAFFSSLCFAVCAVRVAVELLAALSMSRCLLSRSRLRVARELNSDLAERSPGAGLGRDEA